MKKTALLLSLCMLAALCAGCGKKEEGPKEELKNGPKVRVTVSTAGEVRIAAKEVIVQDADGDGVYTLVEAIQSAHDQFGSADKAFKVDDTEYGKSISSLWGDANGMSGYGVYQNNAPSADLTAAVAAGDYIVAYSYQDLNTWSDVYAFFDTAVQDAAPGNVTLTLKVITMDADWNPVEAPLAGAEITVNGEKTGDVTAEDGTVTLSLSKKDENVVSAVAENWILVPPISSVTVK